MATLGTEPTQELEPVEVKAEVADTGTWSKTLSLTVPEKEVSSAYDKLLGTLAGQVRVPGFRPGKVPRGYIEKMFKDDVQRQVAADLIPRAIQTAVKNESIEIVGEPKFEDESVRAERGKDLTFKIEVEVKPTFKLGEHKGLKVEQEEVEVFPEEIERQLDQIAMRFAEEGDAPEGAALQEKDIAMGVLRFLVDGNEVRKEEDSALMLHEGHVVGAHAHLGLSFLEGAKAGEKREAEETLNENFPAEEHRGKKAKIEFEIKKIRRPKVPPIDDELAKKVGAKDAADLREKIEENLRNRIAEETEAKTRASLIDQLIESSPFELPARLLESFGQRLVMDQQMQMLRMGFQPEDLAGFDFAKHNEGNAERKIREYFILDALCKQEKIEVSDEEVDEEVMRLARARGMRAAELFGQLEQEGALGTLKHGLKVKKALDYLTDQADIQVVARKAPEKQGCDHHSHAHEEKDAHEPAKSAKEGKPE